jgi:hypothetical protein
LYPSFKSILTKLIRSPSFNRLAARTHSRVQKLKAQWGGSEEELRQLREQEKLLKEAEEKFKSVDSGTTNSNTLKNGDNFEGNGDFIRFWQVFKDEFRNRNK